MYTILQMAYSFERAAILVNKENDDQGVECQVNKEIFLLTEYTHFYLVKLFYNCVIFRFGVVGTGVLTASRSEDLHRLLYFRLLSFKM